MQEQEDIDLLCPKHGEKIISVSLTETGENQMFCLKCFTYNQIPIQQLTQQLTDLRQVINNQVVQKSTPIQVEGSEQVKQQLNQYQLFKQEKRIYQCYAMATDKDQKILINGQNDNIQIWNFNSDGTIKLKQTLNGHTDYIRCLCFSQKGYWFISGSWDNSMRIWKKENDDQWICQQILENAHKNWIHGIVMNNNEDQFISCSHDQTIKVWMKEKNEIQWKRVQKLTEHTNGVIHLSLNDECNLLASSGFDQLILWEKNYDQAWKLKQVIEYPNDQNYFNPIYRVQYARIKFIDNNELLATTNKGQILKYIQNNKGLFELRSELKNNETSETNSLGSPIIYNQEKGLVIVRLNNEFTSILKRQDDGELIIHQVLNGDYFAGQIIKDGNFIILINNNTYSLNIFK